MYMTNNIYMIKISGKVDKSNTYNGFNANISFFIDGTSSYSYLSTSSLIFIILSDSPK